MMNRETNTPEFDYLTTLFDNLIKGKTVYLPRELIPFIEGASRKSSGRDITSLVYHLIQSECSRTKQETVGVHTERFSGISTNTATIKNSKEFLIQKGFLKVGKSYQNNVSSKKHTLLNNTDLVEYHLEKKNSNQALYRRTQDDERCKQTRNNLDRVVINNHQAQKVFQLTAYEYLLFGIPELRDKKPTSGEKKQIKNGIQIENLPKRSLSNLHSLIIPLNQINHKKGRVFRAKKGRRLFSPLTQLKKHFRDCLSVDDESLVSIDMVCCQPSLISCLSGDTVCLNDCVKDIFYSRLSEELSFTRDQAKESFCEYSFGPNRTENTRAKTAFAIQNIIQKRYPAFGQYVCDEKRGDYRLFAQKVQEIESEFFIDGVLAELQKQNIFALTIHDSVLVKKSDVQRAETALKIIGDAILQKYIPNTESRFEFKVESKVGWFPEINIIENNLIDKFKELTRKKERMQETSLLFMDSDSETFNASNLEADLYQTFTHSIAT